jgi:hypothetical protein
VPSIQNKYSLSCPSSSPLSSLTKLSILYIVVLSLRWRLSLSISLFLYNLASQVDHVDRVSCYYRHLVCIHSFFDTSWSVRLSFRSTAVTRNLSTMFFTKLACAIALASSVVSASPASAAASNSGSSGLSLLSSAVQQGSFNNGRDELGSNEANQALSATSQNNFINNCAGKTLTNGLQITTGSCNGISKYIFNPFSHERLLIIPRSHG